MDSLTANVIDWLSNKDENFFDLARLDVIIAELRGVAKEKRADVKDAEKAKKDADKAELAILGRYFYDSLNVGDEFEFRMASGNKFWAKKIETKSKTGTTAACELITPPEGAKNTKRYPKFSQVVVPADWTYTDTKDSSESVA